MVTSPQPVKPSPQVGSIAHQWANGGPLFKAMIIFAGIFIFALIVQVTREASEAPIASSKATATPSPSKPTQPASWHEVQTIKGQAIKQTETFTIKGDEWRISWDTKPGKHGDMNFQIYVYNASGGLENVAANVIGKDNESTIMRGSGSYYLQINSGQPYTIKVEDWY
jgi:hypothetical protein